VRGARAAVSGAVPAVPVQRTLGFQSCDARSDHAGHPAGKGHPSAGVPSRGWLRGVGGARFSGRQNSDRHSRAQGHLLRLELGLWTMVLTCPCSPSKFPWVTSPRPKATEEDRVSMTLVRDADQSPFLHGRVSVSC
jgi:hypothetical protein